MEKILEKFKDDINDAYIYLSEYRNEYDVNEDEFYEDWNEQEDLWEFIYQIIDKQDSNADQEYWFIKWMKHALVIIRESLLDHIDNSNNKIIARDTIDRLIIN